MTATSEEQPTPAYDLPPANLPGVDWDLRDAADRVDTHLGRADTKAPLVFTAATFVGAAVFTVANRPDTPPWVWTALAAGVGLPIVGALLLTIAAWLPQLGGSHGFPIYAHAADREQLRLLVAADQTSSADRLTWSSQLAYRKYRLIRAAGLFTGAAVVVAAVVGAITLTGHLAG